MSDDKPRSVFDAMGKGAAFIIFLMIFVIVIVLLAKGLLWAIRL